MASEHPKKNDKKYKKHDFFLFLSVYQGLHNPYILYMFFWKGE